MNIAFIPVRGGSKSIPLKNIKEVCSRPLVYWVLDAATQCEKIDKVIVATDSTEIEECVKEYPSKKIEVIGRSVEVSTDTAPTESVMLEYAQNHSFDNIVLIQATSPLLQFKDLDKGFEKLKLENVDSILSVVRQKRFIWEENTVGNAVSTNYDYYNRPRRQDNNGFLVENGAFYITSRERLLESKNRISGNISLVEMEEETYFEIDEPSDLEIIEKLLLNRKKQKNAKKIKIVLTDNDGVLTDSGMYYSESGDELKKFNTKDGMGFQILRERGILTGIITGENRKLVQLRTEKLQLDELYMGITDKLSVVKEICKKYQISLDEIAYIGDDINDLEVIQNVGFGCSVADGMDVVRRNASYVTNVNGGQGALREVVEKLIYEELI